MDVPGTEGRPQRPVSLDPFYHVPERRWIRVLELIEGSKGRRRPKSFDDSYVRIMRALLVRLPRLSASSLQRLRNRSPGPFGALRIQADDDRKQRLEIQCRILAGQSDDEIAQLLGCLPDVVSWYEKMFFDVRDHMPHRDWIVCHVTGFAGSHEFGLDGVKKRLSYFGGPVFAEAVLAVEPDFKPPQSISGLRKLINSPMGAEAAVRTRLAVEMFKITNRNIVQFLQLARKLAAKTDADTQSKELSEIQARAERETIADIQRIMKLDPMTFEQLDKIISGKMPPPRSHSSTSRAKS